MFEHVYADRDLEDWRFHDTDDRLTRYLRDRRLIKLIRLAMKADARLSTSSSVLVTCGGVGGEGTFFADRGFRNVVSTDFSTTAISITRQRDPRIRALPADAERLPFRDKSFDLVLVQDGLHHLSQPAVGLTEMLRVSRMAVGIIEPHTGIAGRLLGTQWEEHDGVQNYVFRWNRNLLQQLTHSYLGNPNTEIHGRQIWDHNLRMAQFVRRLPIGRFRTTVAKFGYASLSVVLPSLGNMMVGVILRNEISRDSVR